LRAPFTDALGNLSSLTEGNAPSWLTHRGEVNQGSRAAFTLLVQEANQVQKDDDDDRHAGHPKDDVAKHEDLLEALRDCCGARAPQRDGFMPMLDVGVAG
jgi:hypothetical protein